MWEWIVAAFARIARQEASADAVPALQAPPAKRHPSHISGRYGSLYTYLENRYADMVVLTFVQIEDLVGSPLPDLARTRHEWWTATEVRGSEPSHSDAWRLAGRTAKPNLTARTVAFEREPGL
jgi:hypothetical protein